MLAAIITIIATASTTGGIFIKTKKLDVRV
jgi:hypothetical protein